MKDVKTYAKFIIEHGRCISEILTSGSSTDEFMW